RTIFINTPQPKLEGGARLSDFQRLNGMEIPLGMVANHSIGKTLKVIGVERSAKEPLRSARGEKDAVLLRFNDERECIASLNETIVTRDGTVVDELSGWQLRYAARPIVIIAKGVDEAILPFD